MSDDPKTEVGSFKPAPSGGYRSSGGARREPSDDLEREIVQRLAQERGQCEVKSCAAVNVPLVFVRWDPTAKRIGNEGVDKKVCFRCAERLAGLR